MPVSIHQLGYKKLSQVIFEWQAADRASLLALFIVLEVLLHWFWCLYVWLRQDTYNIYVDVNLLYPIWLGITLTGLFFWWMVGHLARIKNNDQRLHYWQIVLIVVYSIYIAIVVLVMGHSSLVSGISLVGGAMLGMMLVRRSYIWRAFLWQVAFIIVVTIIPYVGIDLPNLRQLTITSIPLDTYSYLTYSEATALENAIETSLFPNGILSWDNLSELRRSSAFFWRSTHMYLALPKAIFMVYVFRTLLLILDDSKEEILQHANQDELTKLNNRRFGLRQMQQTIMTTSTAQDYSVILLDLDWFKNVNDTYGHEVGDQVLREVAQVLTQAFTDKAIVSRYGGEEFLIVLPDADHDRAMNTAEELRENIAQHVIKTDAGFSFQLTASFGVYTLTHTELLRIRQECAAAVLHNNSSSLSDVDINTIRKNKSTANRTLDNKTKVYKNKQNNRHLNNQNIAMPRKDKQTTEQFNRQQTAQLCSDVCHRLISTADKALYKAKDRGRNKVVSANELLAEGRINEPRYGT
ncbi:diguanylate cyclase [Psychrobacter frigidicola]|uniref:diguanylate cyclase n=1 Tax=Psychrobacter frigidicola TaxID=45611 RepID=A0A5C7A4N3_9GAMM|nr:diguanylate cyclase [Psychrobacter frigidicola]TXD98517.1 diguanylate cyclase [Psychrobacter frigidicola]